MISLLIYLLFNTSFAGHEPLDQSRNIQNLNEFRFFWLGQKWHHMAELKFGKWEDDNSFLSAKLGSRTRLSERLKVGLFFQRAYGVRHDNDWQNVDGQWQWLKNTDRSQDSLIIDSSYKGFLTSKMIYEARVTMEQNINVGRTFAKPRIGASYFLPSSHITLSHEVTIPIESRDNLIQEHWSYLIYSYHYTPWTSFGPLLGRRSVTWEKSETFKQLRTDSYELRETNLFVGINFTHHHE